MKKTLIIIIVISLSMLLILSIGIVIWILLRSQKKIDFNNTNKINNTVNVVKEKNIYTTITLVDNGVKKIKTSSIEELKETLEDNLDVNNCKQGKDIIENYINEITKVYKKYGSKVSDDSDEYRAVIKGDIAKDIKIEKKNCDAISKGLKNILLEYETKSDDGEGLVTVYRYYFYKENEGVKSEKDVLNYLYRFKTKDNKVINEDYIYNELFEYIYSKESTENYKEYEKNKAQIIEQLKANNEIMDISIGNLNTQPILIRFQINGHDSKGEKKTIIGLVYLNIDFNS